MSLPSVGRAFWAADDSVPRFESELAKRLGTTGCVATSSGRVALYLGLRALAAASRRSIVVLPAYTCYTVPASVVRAGLRVRLCDVDPETLDFDPASLREAVREDVLAVVAAGLYGLPADVASVRALANQHGAHVVDDAAQCFGATDGGQVCGARGEFGVMSFGRGKGLSAYEGGALVSGNAALLETARALLDAGTAKGPSALRTSLEAAGYAIFQRPRLYGLVRRIPALKVGVSVFDPSFAAAPLGRFQAALGLRSLRIVDRVLAGQRERARRYAERLAPLPHLSLVRAREGTEPAWLRFPVLAANRGLRDGLLAEATAAGLGVSASYPRPLHEIPELRASLTTDRVACPSATRIAETILTLPTHPAVRPADQDRLARLVEGAVSSPMRAVTGEAG